MSYFIKVWKGEERFNIVFRGWLFGLQIVLALLIKADVKSMAVDVSTVNRVDLSTAETNFYFLIILSLLSFVWAGVGAWRSSRRLVNSRGNLMRAAIIVFFLFQLRLYGDAAPFIGGIHAVGSQH